MQPHVQERHALQIPDKLCELSTEHDCLQEVVVGLKSELNCVRVEADSLRAENEQLSSEVAGLKSDNRQLHKTINALFEKFEKVTERLHEVEHFVRHGKEPRDVLEIDGPVKGENSSHRPTSLHLRGTAVTASVGTAGGKGHFHDSEKDGKTNTAKDGQKLAVIQEDVDSQKTQLIQMAENVRFLQETMTRQAIAVDDVRLRQDVLEVKTTNGVFLWKIPDVRRRYRDAVEGKTLSLYSPPFYTSPHGYRMCVRAYLNGDGIGKGTHISVFFVVMRSEHDSLLSWPFKQSVRFTLVNQRNPANSHSEAFTPDLQSASFQRPQKDMNIASGFPKFVRQSALQDENFTLGNALFIKAQVDLSGLPQ